MNYQCPVCGYAGLQEPPRDLESGGSYEICPSCGFQFGVSDSDLCIRDEDWRAAWIESGMPWSSVSIKPPPAWDPREQLKEVLN
ncbi:MAG: hypothetical protein DI556_22730 [Rhodovulum sulfidophilum]|uniref:Uncharacterized protein n=1 Tax=Rhodovulum sulfidophilum TaxID=35806 RepID=A0A2W5PLD6_RHOSU|nr:MAG: hypothetical protein DI556_22730 [Rhodovulum sulfidophilum]